MTDAQDSLFGSADLSLALPDLAGCAACGSTTGPLVSNHCAPCRLAGRRALTMDLGSADPIPCGFPSPPPPAAELELTADELAELEAFQHRNAADELELERDDAQRRVLARQADRIARRDARHAGAELADDEHQDHDDPEPEPRTVADDVVAELARIADRTEPAPTPAPTIDNSPEAVAGRRAMFAGFGWTK